jgi:cytochrome c
MNRPHRLAMLIGATLLCVGMTATTPLAAQMVIPKAAPASGDKMFGQQCGACHSATPGETRVGPSLAGVVGRKAGTLAGYQYSAALKKSGQTWTAASLDKWLSGTQADVPGSKMSYAQADPAKRKAIIDYLTSISKK